MNNKKIVNLYVGHYDDGIIEGNIVNNYEVYERNADEEFTIKKKVLSFQYADGGHDTRILEIESDKGILRYFNNLGVDEERKIIKIDQETWRLDKSNELGDFYGETLKYYFPT